MSTPTTPRLVSVVATLVAAGTALTGCGSSSSSHAASAAACRGIVLVEASLAPVDADVDVQSQQAVDVASYARATEQVTALVDRPGVDSSLTDPSAGLIRAWGKLSSFVAAGVSSDEGSHRVLQSEQAAVASVTTACRSFT